MSDPSLASASSSDSNPSITPADEELLFHADLLRMVELFQKHDDARGESPAKKLVAFVRYAPSHGITKTLEDLRTQLTTLYATHRADILEGYDDFIFKPSSILLKVNRKIYLSVGLIYTKVPEKEQDDLHAALLKSFVYLVTDKSDRQKLLTFVEAKAKPSTAGFSGMGGIGDMIGKLLSGAGGAGGEDGIASIMSEITDRLKSTSLNPDDPSSIDPNAIGNLVKELISDKGPDSLASKLSNNPVLASFAEKLQVK